MEHKTTIEFPKRSLDLLDMVEILTDCLEFNEIEELAEELLFFIRPVKINDDIDF